ncbi:DUF2249 domain-containing protein [Chromobacterium sp. IIBBL 290-4]|uniref:DUF2249 domain-containing protein n=1 Tax=Chromobacterium sp. IIBBL 290-4 TaxID=2953890 RepID=UPI0020B83486|nr:DUF2249 domain-containing protein [Chromobacterium sp. IIBBL 290-4]UTH73767.1 DUF2249 domain-containing protein [Chromobacterium sp. IIBBL 290-4]
MPIDLRHLPPPEPMERILTRAAELGLGESESFLLPHYPAPLLPLLEEYGGLGFRCELSGDGGVLLTLERS